MGSFETFNRWEFNVNPIPVKKLPIPGQVRYRAAYPPDTPEEYRIRRADGPETTGGFGDADSYEVVDEADRVTVVKQRLESLCDEFARLSIIVVEDIEDGEVSCGHAYSAGDGKVVYVPEQNGEEPDKATVLEIARKVGCAYQYIRKKGLILPE